MKKPAIYTMNTVIVFVLMTLISCGSGSSDDLGAFASANDPGAVTSPDDSSIVVSLDNSGAVVLPDNTGITNVSENDTFPFSGQFVVDEYSPSNVNPQFEGIVEINPSPLTKTRILNGNLPRRYPNGRTTYREACGRNVARIALAEPNGISTPITPCSSEIPNDGFSPTDFGQSNLSPDNTKVAVETRVRINSGVSFSTLVFDVTTQTVLATWVGGYNGTWTPDGLLLLASDEGLFLLDTNFENPARIGLDINGPVGNPDVHADGSAVVFEFNQQIWGMNIDGSEPRELISAGSRLHFPVWAPDGSVAIAYLELPSDDDYLGIILVTDLSSGRTHGLDLAPVLEFGSANFLRTVNGPLSWNL